MNKLSRPLVAGISIVIGIVVIAILSFVLPAISKGAARIVLDYNSALLPYPFTIQNFMLLLFSIGCGELFLRWRESSSEMSYIRRSDPYLPEDERIVLQSQDLGPIRQKVKKDITGKEDRAFLPNMINRCILQFQASRSVDQTNSVLNSIVDVYFHQIELKYTILRYISWVIPTIGFIGTVVGIAYSLSLLGETSAQTSANILKELTTRLAVAFNTTMVALVLSAILVFFIHIIQEMEEKSLNKAMEYCLNNLINRLYTSD